MRSKSRSALSLVGILASGCFGSQAGAMRVPRVEFPREVAVIKIAMRPITVQEVFRAIRNSMDGLGSSAAANLHPEDILLQAQILVGPGDAGLEVLRSDFDSALKRGRFLLWTSHDPKVLPFLVTVQFTEDVPKTSLRAAVAGKAGSRPDAAPIQTRNAKAEVLVRPGEEATLVLHSGSMRMIAAAVPLERGTMGQRIHVRVVDTGKVFSAQVVGRGSLDLKF
jgi:hypothetical protein